jgi:hypothetical protein
MIDLLNRIGFKQVAFGGGGGGGGGTNTPLETTISNQPHALAYITPSEEGLLRSLGGTGQAGPGGVPAFPPVKGKTRGKSNEGTGFSGNYKEPKAPVAKSTPAPKEKSTPSYDFSSSNDDNDPPPVYTPPPPVYTPPPPVYTPPPPVYTPPPPVTVTPPPPVVEDPPPGGVNDLFAGMRQSKQYIDELKKGFTGAVTIGERDGPSLGGAQFTNEFRDYAKSMGYEIDSRHERG